MTPGVGGTMLNCFNREKVTWVQFPGNTHNFFSGSFKFIIDMENTYKVLVVYLPMLCQGNRHGTTQPSW